ncbi:MAG: TolB family protein [Thermoanaerobaculia bacterium]
MKFRTRDMAPFLVVFAGCSTTLAPIPEAWKSSPAPRTFTQAELRRTVVDTTPVARPAADLAEAAEVGVVTDAEGARIYRGSTALTPSYRQIESFDVSLDRREIVFSAKRDSNFDVGLVSLDGSQVNWIPEDPADEVAPRWAPRGNKASFIVRNRGGDLIRTVHIPTAFQLIVDFPFGIVRGLAWDDAGERFAVAWETADASQRIETMKYDGLSRRIAMPPAVRLPVSVTPSAGGLMLRPESVTYQERLPLVIWVASGDKNEWNEARGALMRGAKVAALVLDRAPDAAVLAALAETAWIDPKQIFAVGAVVPGAVSIIGDPSIPAGFYRTGPEVISVHPSGVESLAVGWIRKRLSV